MSSQLPDRLRKCAREDVGGPPTANIMWEAADEIDALRALISEASQLLEANWASKEYLMSNPPKHLACFRAWEILRRAG